MNAQSRKLYYQQKFQDHTFVLKISGDLIESKSHLENILHDIKELFDLGIRIVLVHGGGIQADNLSDKLGHKPEKINGRRVTKETDLEIAKMLFGGSLNLEILSCMKKIGLKGMRVSGLDGNLLEVKQRNHHAVDYGFVGDIENVHPKILFDIIKQDCLPVVSPVAADNDGNILNINADTIAVDIAIAMKAEKLILFSKTHGVYNGDKLLSTLTKSDADTLIQNGIIKDGMIVKIENCFHAIHKGVKRIHIINGLTEKSLLSEVLTKEGIGTMITSEGEREVYYEE